MHLKPLFSKCWPSCPTPNQSSDEPNSCLCMSHHDIPSWYMRQISSDNVMNMMLECYTVFIVIFIQIKHMFSHILLVFLMNSILNYRQTLIWGGPNPKNYVFRLILQLSLGNPLKTGDTVCREWRCSWSSIDKRCKEQPHLSDQKFHCLLMCALY